MRGKIIIVALATILTAALCHLGRSAIGDGGPGLSYDGSGGGRCERVVSMAPSITETLFALGLGDRVVGVTDYCDYPPEVSRVRKVGGYYDPNFEAMVYMKPDLVVILPEHETVRASMSGLGVETLEVSHRTVDDILASIDTLGKTCGAEDRAREMIEDLAERLERIDKKTRGLSRPRVLISVGRNMGSGKIEDIYVSGRTSIYNYLLPHAGGRNAYTKKGIEFPKISTEGLIRLDPDIIIDIVPDLEDMGYTKQDVIGQWSSAGDVAAVRDGRVYVFTDMHAVRPGPRFILTVEDLARAIHPEADWD